MENLAERVEAIETIYDMRKGQNVMLDTLVDRLNDHTIGHKRVQQNLDDRLSTLEDAMKNMTMELGHATRTSKIVCQEMLTFRKDIDKYYEYFDGQCKSNLMILSKYQQKADKTTAASKRKIAEVDQITAQIVTKQDMDKEVTKQLEKRLGEIVGRMQYAEHNIERLKVDSTTKNETEILDERIQKKLEGLQYRCEDIRNIIKHTDTYIEKFLPFKILKFNGKYLIDLFGAEIEEKILLSERNKVKALYVSMLDDSQEQVTFKE